MTFEYCTLLLAATLALVHIAAAAFSFKAQVGNAYTVGARDEGLQPFGLSGRLHRAQSNFMETFPLFVACIFLVGATQSTGVLSKCGCILYLGGRIFFLPLYAIGVPWLRTFSWNIATFGLAMIGLSAALKMA